MTHLVIDYILESMNCDYSIGIHNIIYFWTWHLCSLAGTKMFTGTKEAKSIDGSTRTDEIWLGGSQSHFDLPLPNFCSFLMSFRSLETEVFLIIEGISAPFYFAFSFKVYFCFV